MSEHSICSTRVAETATLGNSAEFRLSGGLSRFVRFLLPYLFYTFQHGETPA